MQQNTVAKVVKNHISEILAIVFKISKGNTISADSVIGARTMSPLPHTLSCVGRRLLGKSKHTYILYSTFYECHIDVTKLLGIKMKTVYQSMSRYCMHEQRFQDTSGTDSCKLTYKI